MAGYGYHPIITNKTFENFMRHLSSNLHVGDCWEWKGARADTGYSVFGNMDNRYGHRVSYVLFNGDIPEGKEIDHKCGNRGCVNPLHLQAITHKQNIVLGKKRRRKQRNFKLT